MRPTEYRAQLRRILALTLLALGPLAGPAYTSPLFDDESVIEIRLSGPLRTLAGLIGNTDWSFSSAVGNEDTDSRVRYIGHFFEEAENSTKLPKQFERDCVGPR